jgi:hypothetical protein
VRGGSYARVCTIGGDDGVWGAGLDSGDFAMDLRRTIGAVARLPFDGDRLVEILAQTEPTVANNPEDEDHTTFWLVVADQFAKRAIICDRAREKGLAIIDAGSDLAMHAKLGMSPSDLSQRRKMLQDVRVRLTTPPARRRPRSVLEGATSLPDGCRRGTGLPNLRWKMRQSLFRLEGAGQGHDGDGLETGWDGRP